MTFGFIRNRCLDVKIFSGKKHHIKATMMLLKVTNNLAAQSRKIKKL